VIAEHGIGGNGEGNFLRPLGVSLFIDREEENIVPRLAIVLIAGDFCSTRRIIRVGRTLMAQLPVLLGLMCTPSIWAQPAQTPAVTEKRLTFDAASIRVVPAEGKGRKDEAYPGRIRHTNISLSTLLREAYGMNSFQVVAPSWLGQVILDIEATMPQDRTKEQINEMMRNLLQDRFKLATHRETRELPIYSLVVAKGGPKMKESVDTGTPDVAGEPAQPGRREIGKDGFPTIKLDRPALVLMLGGGSLGTRLIAKEQTMSQLAERLAVPLGRMVRDATGLTAKYDFTVSFATEGVASRPDDVGDAPNVRTALEEQLGLKLESGKGPVEMIVVDHIEKTPTEN
jgi:uncharacterized protein (TIGR03435 family)